MLLFRLLVLLITISALSAIFFTSRSAPHQLGEKRLDYQAMLAANYLLPANFVFLLVWPVVFAGLAALAFHQVLPAQWDNVRYQKAGPWLVVNAVGLWGFVYLFTGRRTPSLWLLNLLTWGLLAASFALYRALGVGRLAVAGLEAWLRHPVSVYLGWLTVASLISLVYVLIRLGWQPKPAVGRIWAAALLVGLLPAVYFICEYLNDPVYLLPFLLAFIGIAFRQSLPESVLARVAWCCAGACLVLLLWKSLPRTGLDTPSQAKAQLRQTARVFVSQFQHPTHLFLLDLPFDHHAKN